VGNQSRSTRRGGSNNLPARNPAGRLHPARGNEPGAAYRVDNACRASTAKAYRGQERSIRYRERPTVNQFQRDRQRGCNLEVSCAGRGNRTREIAGQHDALQQEPVLHQDRAIETVVIAANGAIAAASRVLAENDACRNVGQSSDRPQKTAPGYPPRATAATVQRGRRKRAPTRATPPGGVWGGGGWGRERTR